jgi:hypothetical protein
MRNYLRAIGVAVTWGFDMTVAGGITLYTGSVHALFC